MAQIHYGSETMEALMIDQMPEKSRAELEAMCIERLKGDPATRGQASCACQA
jgi:hypothetical protein